jgi:hypothetical protein
MMKFDPEVHTKEFLLSNIDVALELAKNSAEFSVSPLSQECEVLRLANNRGWTVAHQLACYQTNWLTSDITKDFDVLRLNNEDGWTVAHYLAQYQPNWLASDASKDFHVLQLSAKNGWTVAHYLAQCQPKWLTSDASKDFDVLRLSVINGWTVAHALALHQPNCIHHEPLFHKQTLTLSFKGELLAEFISGRFGLYEGLDTATMAMKLIEQGAAYQHSTPMTIKVGGTLIKQGVLLLHDCYEPIIGFKQLQALYSTCAHNVAKIKRTDEHKSLEKWNGILGKSEKLLRQHLTAHPELFDIEHTIDIFCEPGNDLLRRIMAERTINTTLSDVFQTEHIPPAPEQGLY